MTNDSKEPFTIQAGKRYNRRDGEISSTLIPDIVENRLYDAVHQRSYHHSGLHTHGNWNVDLISEYIEPTAAPVTDEWGPWIGWNGGECPVAGRVVCDLMNGTVGRTEGKAVFLDWSFGGAYRIKKEPEVLTDVVMINLNSGMVHDHIDGVSLRSGVYSKAIITLTNGEPSIRWADVDDT